MDEVNRRIKELEAQGHTGRTNPELDRLNRIQTSALSVSEAKALLYERARQGKPIGKLAAYLTQNGAM
ncbi:MAG: hypothetical protein WBE26_19590 [Phycisphaerae bacterium]